VALVLSAWAGVLVANYSAAAARTRGLPAEAATAMVVLSSSNAATTRSPRRSPTSTPASQ